MTEEGTNQEDSIRMDKVLQATDRIRRDVYERPNNIGPIADVCVERLEPDLEE